MIKILKKLIRYIRGCRKKGIKCSVACENCMGMNCTNAKVVSNEDALMDECTSLLDDNMNVSEN